jgi:hypothetical protein
VEFALIVATLLGGIAALWFFWDKVAAFFKNDSPKDQHATNSDQESILRLIGESSPSDWNYYDPEAKYYFKKDVQLFIDRHPVERNNQFPEAWAHEFPDRSAHAVKFTIYYGATPITDVWTVEVDGSRSYIPYPKSAKVLTISKWQYAFGRVVNIANGTYDYDGYLHRAGISIVDDSAT